MLIPKNRHEYYLAVISGNDYPTFPPKIREEQYLAKLAGREVDVPNPKTPKERAYYNIINDIKFEPENRWQTFVAAANDDSITAPVPRTREEIWWSNIALSQEVIVEYVGTLPATLTGTKAGYLESYKIYGNTEQTGAPTPENPIEPSGCGERTENLFDKDNTEGIEDRYYIDKTTGNKVRNPSYYISAPIAVTSEETYCWIFRIASGGAAHSAPTVGFFDASDNQLGVANHGISIKVFSFTTPVNCAYIKVSVHKPDIGKAMLVLGSAPPTSYIPYGYKLPILSNSTVTDIYLGEVETTRRIKKLVLTGGTDETYTYDPSYARFYFVIPDILGIGVSLTPLYCTHYQNILDGRPIGNVPNYSIYTGGGIDSNKIFIKTTGYTSVADFKAFLAAQYANGTPVTVWYVLAEPETDIVNEPLMRIGDYADTIDSTQSTVRIPTAAGNTIIDYDGTPKPDKVELTYKTVERTYISSDDEVYQDTYGQLLGG